MNNERKKSKLKNINESDNEGSENEYEKGNESSNSISSDQNKDTSKTEDDEEQIDIINGMTGNLMSYFCCICCPRVCANGLTKCMHHVLLVFVLFSLGISVTNFILGPNVALF